jgi:hypothetical protein
MKIYHYYMAKAPLCLFAYVVGSHDVAFLIVGMLSMLCIPLFVYFNE